MFLLTKTRIMKTKVLLFAVVFAFGFFSAYAQEVKNGDKILNLGIGVGSGLGYGSGYKTTMPAISGSIEFIVKDDLFDNKGAIGVGGYVGYSSGKSEYTYTGGTWGWKYSNLVLGGRGNLHYSLVDKLDTYAGLMMGYWVSSSTEYGTIQTGYSAEGGGFIWSGFVGARYFFSDSFAGMLELGSGIAYMNIGIALKF
jgi:hypothetical protein